MKIFQRFLQVFLVLGFLLVAAFFVWLLAATRPEAAQKSTPPEPPLVEVQPVALTAIELSIPSQGLIRAKRRTDLAAQVSGKIVWTSEQFLSGGRFREGESIVRIDPSDYESALAQAQATLVEAEVLLTTERARAEQARRDWDRLGRGTASPLTLRKPQIRSAESQVEAARAAVQRAQQDLERTDIKAPFEATVAEKRTEIGNFVAAGSPVAELFQTTPLEVRLPLAVDEIVFLQTGKDGAISGDVLLTTTVGNRTAQWNGKINRTEGEIDRDSRSLFVVADIFPAESPSPIDLQPGLFVEAAISGIRVENIAQVPATAFLDLERVALVTSENRLAFRKVTVLRREGNIAFVTAGLEEGDLLCLTELATMIEGTKVRTRPSEPEEEIFKP